jgi:ABC-2 type transport system ATP-binding protein
VHKVIAFVRGFYPTWDQDYCNRLLSSLSVDPTDRIMTLSFGTRIKLALVLALSWRPSVLILDEPTVGLDAISKQAVFSELLGAVREGERTVLISSHGLADIERFADHLGMIRNGRLLFEGATTDVIARFRVVDFVVANGERLADRPGVFVQRRDGARWRALIDLEHTPLETLHGLGATPIADAPVTLEELFITVGKA